MTRDWFVAYKKDTGEIVMHATGDRNHIVPYRMEPFVKANPGMAWKEITEDIKQIDPNYLDADLAVVPELLLHKLAKHKKIDVATGALVDA